MLWLSAFIILLYYPINFIWWKRIKSSYCLIFGITNILIFLFSILEIRKYNDYYNNNFYGSILITYIIVLVWGSDASAYIFGTIFGKKKLASKISPKKTWVGFFSAILTSSVISLTFITLKIININNFIFFFIYSVISVLISVLGDLTESLFKREANLKDSSNLIPGHGGLLDRIDSLISSVPLFFYLLSLSKII